MESSLVMIKPSTKTDITIIDSKGETITDQKMILMHSTIFLLILGLM